MSSSPSSIVLYDLTCSGRQACWSPNTWKTRLLLNFKNLSYETRWLEYPDIAPTLEGRHFPPNEKGSPYTLPAISMPQSKGNVQDSRLIADAVEAAQPTPSLHLDSPLLLEIQTLMDGIMKMITPIALPLVVRETLNPRSKEWFDRTMAPHFGMSFAQLEKEKGGDAAWARLQEPLKSLAGVLKRNDGPYVMGQTVSYADFVVGAFLQCGKRVGDGSMYKRIVKVDKAFEMHFEATMQWAKRDDR